MKWKNLFLDFIGILLDLAILTKTYSVTDFTQDIFIGLPHMKTVNYDDKLRKDLEEFLIAELKIDVTHVQMLLIQTIHPIILYYLSLLN